jgi:tetratricopeptide (TPR) repeat protein
MGNEIWDLISEADGCNCECQYDRALELIDRAITLDPQMAWPHHIRGMTLRGMKRHREAVAEFTRALELNPRQPGTLAWRARTFTDLEEHRSAAEDWLRLVREFPDGQHSTMGVCPLDWSNGAEAFARASEPGRAIELLEEYLAHHASRVGRYSCYKATPLRLLARLVREAGDPARAAELEAEALKYPYR